MTDGTPTAGPGDVWEVTAQPPLDQGANDEGATDADVATEGASPTEGNGPRVRGFSKRQEPRWRRRVLA